MMQQIERRFKEPLFEFEKLKVYDRAVDLSDFIFNITKEYPKFWQYNLMNQINRSALSISLNLAEGLGSHYKNQKKRYFRIARGSLYECLPALKILFRQELIDDDEYYFLYQECYEISSMISGLIKSLDSKKNSITLLLSSIFNLFGF